MMYGNKLAAAIKVGNKVLREFKDTVYIPFGSEYAITLKNLHTTRAVVNVFIDGDNVVPGGLVLDPGRSIDLERSIRNNNLTEGNRFKFIERTSKIEQHRGIDIEDGLVRIEYQFEITRPAFNIGPIYGSNTFPHYPPGVRSPTSSEYQGVVDKYTITANSFGSDKTVSQMNVGGALRGIDYSRGEAVKSAAASAINQVAPNTTEYHDGSATMDWCANETGITVPGSKSTQKFQHTTMGVLEQTKHNLVFKLVGDLGHNKPVEKPVTVKHRPECVTCGHRNKASAKYCSSCGTALEVFA